MASAVIRTYERMPGFSRNGSMRKQHNPLNGYVIESIPLERSYTSETVADSSSIRRTHSKFRAGPFVAQNFSTITDESSSDTASEDSCSLRRKSMSINGDVCKDNLLFGILSSTEKRQLRRRLRTDLQHVRSLIKKIEYREAQVRNHMPRHSGNNRSGVNLSATNGYYLPAAAEASQQEKFFLLEKNRSKSGVVAKHSLQGRIDVSDAKRTKKMDFSYGKRVNELLKQCGVMLKKLMTHKFSWVFNEPVDVVKLNLHDYFKIIKRPMDLGTIKKKLDSGVYLLPTEFCDDMRLTFSNAMKYNPQGHDVYLMADTLRCLFENKWSTMEEKVRELDTLSDRFIDINSRDHETGFVESFPPPPAVRQPPAQFCTPAPIKKSKSAFAGNSSSKSVSEAASQLKRPMTFAEKQQLGEDLGSLPPDKLDQAVQIMKKNPNLLQNDDEIEVEIDSFDPETLWELHSFVVDCKTVSANKKPVTVLDEETREHQMGNGVLASTKPILKGNEAGEEDVDIGDDMPAKVFPPVVIEKDRLLNVKEGSSSSSSSSSGSSSSDSDSGSSSGSDSDGDEVHSPGVASKLSSAAKV